MTLQSRQDDFSTLHINLLVWRVYRQMHLQASLDFQVLYEKHELLDQQETFLLRPMMSLESCFFVDASETNFEPEIQLQHHGCPKQPSNNRKWSDVVIHRKGWYRTSVHFKGGFPARPLDWLQRNLKSFQYIFRSIQRLSKN